MPPGTRLGLFLLAGWLSVNGAITLAQSQEDAPRAGLNIRTSGGMRIVGVKSIRPPGPALRAPSEPALAVESYASTDSAPPVEVAGIQSTLHPRPPLAGFSPLVAITTSDKRKSDDFDWDHVLESTYVGYPLNPPASENFIIGVFDSGSIADLVGDPWNAVVGLTGTRLSGSTYPIGGTGGTVDADITNPLACFAGGLSAVDATSGLLNLTQLAGHSNVAMLAAPEIACGNGEALSAVIGTDFLSFFNTIIHVDTPLHRNIGGDDVLSPDVQMLDQSVALPRYPRSLSMTFSAGGLPALTASYYGELDPWTFEVAVVSPTLLGIGYGLAPFGGYYFATIGAIEGEPSPTNPLQYMRMMVDTGAQSSIITTGMAANLNLDVNNPDFTVDVCGIGGLTTDVPGFYVDYIKMNAAGAIEFSQVPFVALDVEGLPSDCNGILGMNFFWNRNVIFEPSLSGSGFLHVSAPIPFAYGDLDRDLDVDQADFAFFQSCSTGPGMLFSVECSLADADGDDDVDQADFGFFQRCISGENVPANVNCGP